LIQLPTPPTLENLAKDSAMTEPATGATPQSDDPAIDTRPGSEGFRSERGEALEKGDDFNAEENAKPKSIEELDEND
jgi:hypothetical protein